ncbi:hypothetical protein GUITHDRAFT_109818 [Guillardia theta CCMP2712]|uniref:Uncharacterized protein n=1 Tax=Guillardia theta (strain CCMP2712) TaxID=905079 RepID=L1J757_GUITC|nr:hypothetical protein GUITHDRAFT_109818 [Guillardia theta CCMP2712]EKX44368.1 hypothetical protein GUITHDRAFT_109818 [Guillardia theta CCMP2712]|eukprot:XP_005831348.1 hypothetical protein GUITHDRAFT_109818 [Guillardia theta CCMP2712]
MSPTGSASWWPWKSSKLDLMERHLDDMKKHMEEVKANKDKLIADKDKLIADKDKLIADKDKLIADKDAQLEELRADKDAQLKELKADKDAQIEDLRADKERLYDELQLQKMETLRELSRVKVVANNRALIQIAVARYSSKSSFTQGLEKFVNEHLLTDTKILSEYGREVCKKLRDFGFPGKEESVAKELADLMSARIK